MVGTDLCVERERWRERMGRLFECVNLALHAPQSASTCWVTKVGGISWEASHHTGLPPVVHTLDFDY